MDVFLFCQRAAYLYAILLCRLNIAEVADDKGQQIGGHLCRGLKLCNSDCHPIHDRISDICRDSFTAVYFPIIRSNSAFQQLKLGTF